MRKCLVVASALFALAPVVPFNTASADERPAKRAVDFTPRLNGSNTSLGKTGVVVKIQKRRHCQRRHHHRPSHDRGFRRNPS